MPEQLKFPLSQDKVYQARIRFTPYKVEPIDVEAQKIFKASVFDNVFRRSESNGDTAENPTGNPETLPPVKLSAEQQQNAIEKFYKGPQSVIDPDFPLISMYVPVSVQFSDNIQYDGANLAGMGTLAGAALNSGDSLFASAYEALTAGTATVFSFFKGALTGEAARLAAVQSTKVLPAGIQAAVQIGTQRVINPNTKSLFKGVNLREFTFQFKMIPTSEQEAQQIDAIIRTFRTCMYPEAFDPSETSENLPYALKFPNQFAIDFMFGNTHLKTQKIELSYLRNISVVYNSSGGGYHEGGWPTEIDMSLSFMETRSLSRKDILRQHGIDTPTTNNPVATALANNTLQLSTRDDGGL